MGALALNFKNLNTTDHKVTTPVFYKSYKVNFIRLFDIKFIKTTYTVNKLLEN